MKSCKPSTVQLALNFEAGLADAYPTCREFIATRVHQQGKYQKEVAADMDLSPSHLTRKLAQSPNDSMAFTLDNLEDFIQTQGDVQPIYYLIEKYLTDRDDEIEQLRRRLAELEGRNNSLRPSREAS